MQRTGKQTESLVCQMYLEGEELEDIVDHTGVSRTTVWRILKRNNVSLNRKTGPKNTLNCDDRYFKQLDEHSAYWLGFLMADGSVDQGRYLTLKLAKKDRQHIEHFRLDLDSEHAITDGRTKRGYEYSRIKVCRKSLVEDLYQWGVVPNKTKKLQMPDLADHLFRHYLRGFFDGDGSFWVKRKPGVDQICFSVRSSSKCFLESVRTILQEEVGIELGSINEDSNSFRLRCEGNVKVKKLADWLYKDASRFLSRKRDLVVEHFESLE